MKLKFRKLFLSLFAVAFLLGAGACSSLGGAGFGFSDGSSNLLGGYGDSATSTDSGSPNGSGDGSGDDSGDDSGDGSQSNGNNGGSKAVVAHFPTPSMPSGVSGPTPDVNNPKDNKARSHDDKKHPSQAKGSESQDPPQDYAQDSAQSSSNSEE